MKDDYTTNSHYRTYTFLFKGWENVLFESSCLCDISIVPFQPHPTRFTVLTRLAVRSAIASDVAVTTSAREAASRVDTNVKAAAIGLWTLVNICEKKPPNMYNGCRVSILSCAAYIFRIVRLAHVPLQE